MDTNELLDRLNKATKNDRLLDEEIGLIAGFKKLVSSGSASANVWIGPGGSKPSPLPGFTNSIDISKNFIEMVAPNSVVACKWSADRAYAQALDQPVFDARTPALALCMVGVSLHELRTRTR